MQNQLFNKELFVRTITAIVMLVVAFGSLYYGGTVFILFMLALICIASYETQRLIIVKHESIIFVAASVSAAVISVAQIAGWSFFPIVWLSLCAVVLVLLFYEHQKNQPIVEVTVFILLMAAFYSLLSMRLQNDSGFERVFFLVMLVICCDVCAYISGKLIGGTKLAPSISPGKTWSGFYGAIGAGTIFAFLIGNTLEIINPSMAVLIYCFLVAIATQLFDLFESALKRYAGKKDSGTILPGHGGMLDRIDGMIGMAVLTGVFHVFGWDGFIWRINQ